MQKGIVYIVGAGPGDPGLLSIKALNLIKEAELVIYDRLVDPRILNLINPQAKKIYAGKESSMHSLPQNKINLLLKNEAQNLKKIVRLKGGDPFIFGRGGEEAEYLKENKIKFEIVPGITSAIASPAYAGIPATHRDYTSTVTFITGHEDPSKRDSKINWKNLAENDGTLIFLMGREKLKIIQDELLKYKKDPQTPAALVRWGTRPCQETITGTLKDIYDLAEKHNLKPPVITIIGGVVNLRNKLRWFDNKPLFGKTILITRSREQASLFSQSLEELGAYCLEYPLIKIVPLENKTPINKALINLKKYHWLILTSQNAVNYFIKYLKDLRKLSRIKIAVIGEATAKTLENYYIKPDLIPKKFIAESLIKEFKKINLKNKNILIPRAEVARDILQEELKSQGANVEVIPIYKTILEEDGKEELIKLFKENKINLITFASSSTVKNFDDLIGKEVKNLLKKVKILCIGPITAKTAYDLGYKVNAVPKEYTISGMAKECLKLFSKKRNDIIKPQRD